MAEASDKVAEKESKSEGKEAVVSPLDRFKLLDRDAHPREIPKTNFIVGAELKRQIIWARLMSKVIEACCGCRGA